MRSAFKRTVNSNKYQSEVATQAPNPYLDYLIGPSFQEVNRRFVLSLENNFRTYDNIQKTSTGQRDDYMTSCLLD